MPRRPPAKEQIEILHEWGDHFRIVIDEKTATGEPEKIRIQMRSKEEWRTIARNNSATRGPSVVGWTRKAIDKYVKRWRASVDKRATELQTELEELAKTEEVVQQLVGAP